jgi:hypothetical protein
MVPTAGRSVVTLVDRCRRAALAFTNHAEPWTKADLAAWLVGPYREATRTGSVPPPGRSAPPPPGQRVRHAVVDDLLADARVQVVAALENVAISRTKIAFARPFVANNTVKQVVDQARKVGWLPVDAPRMRLTHRVLALFAADALTRPADYETLAVCHQCERVRFRSVAERCDCEPAE